MYDIKVTEKELDKEVAQYVKDLSADQQYNFSENKMNYSNFLSNKMLVVMAIKEGIPFSLFTKIRDVAPFSQVYWAEFLDLSIKSLQRYENTNRSFKPIHSEKILELAEVTNLGVDVFGDFEKFKLWLETPNFALGKMKPMDLLKNSYGKEMVVGELRRIEHGILS